MGSAGLYCLRRPGGRDPAARSVDRSLPRSTASASLPPLRWSRGFCLACRHLLLAAAVALAAACAAPAPPAAPRSLLLVTLDTLRADRLGAYGSPRGLTPNLDRLAREGVRFASASCAAPLTLPSHATLLSGLLPPRHGLHGNGTGRLPDDVETLATRLAAAGYRSGAFVGAFVLDHRFGLERGFGVYDDEIPQRAGAAAGLEAERPGREVVDRALAWLARAGSGPLFLWVHLFDAHAPYAPPEPWRTRHAEAPYDGEVAEVDAQVGRLLAALAAAGRRGDTVVAVVGDHGEALGEHGEPTHGLLLYEPTVAVPWLVAAPAGITPGSVVRTPVGLADVAPTLAGLVGHPWTGARLDGRDLSAALAAAREPEAADLYVETDYPAIFGWSPLAALRRGDRKWIAAPRPELYDLASDPGEARNLAADERRAGAELDRALEALRAAARVAAPAAGDEETRARLAALGYVSGTATGQGPRPDPKDHVAAFARLEAARAELERGRFAGATAELERLVAEEPDNPVFRGTLAEARRRAGASAEALAERKRALAAAPGDAQGWYNLAAALVENGRPAEAEEALAEALRLEPRYAEGWNLLGIARTRRGEERGAAEAFARALDLAPASAATANNLGNALRVLGRFDDAERVYRRSLEIDAGGADAWNGLGTVEVERGRPERALPLFGRALELAPKRHEVVFNQALALDQMGRTEGAAAAYRDFLQRTEGDPAYAGQRDAARRLLDRLAASGGPVGSRVAPGGG
jgi:choline-sulfatase